jgi:hypothetical protein
VKKILQSKGVRRCGKIFGGLLLVYFLLYSMFSIFGRYQPIAVDVNRVMEYAWAPVGFYDPNHAWEGSSYAVHHPTEKTGGWHDSMLITFFPLWVLDNKFIHKGPPETEADGKFPPIPLGSSHAQNFP